MAQSNKDRALAFGNEELKKFLLKAKKNKVLYYTVPSVARSGMSRTIELYIIEKNKVVNLWPTYEPKGLPHLTSAEHQAGLEIIRKDWGFNWDKAAFDISGYGMDMVYALVDNLAHKAGLGSKYANEVRRETLGRGR